MKKRIRIGIIAASLFVCVSLLGSSSTTAQDVGAGGIGGRPAYPRQDNSRSESIFIHTLNNGESVNDGVKVINNTDRQRDILVYATDSVASSGGAFACAQFVDEKVDVGSWVTMQKESLTLEPNSSEIVDFTINVPLTADAGEHNGCIVVQEAIDPTSSDQGIGLSFRTASRVAILVPGDLSRAEFVKRLEIVDFKSRITQTEIVLTPFIENQGIVSVDTDIQTRIKTFFGMTISTVGGEFPVLRTQTGEWNFPHERPFWGGWYRASVTASYDENIDNFIGEGEPTIRTLVYPEMWIFVLPSLTAGLIYLVLLALLVLIVYRAKRMIAERRRIANTWVTHTLKKPASIKAIAKARGVHWKQIAKVNKLKPPYELKAGQKIKIPPKKDS